MGAAIPDPSKDIMDGLGGLAHGFFFFFFVLYD
jgi:hypothetical protein